MADSEVVFDSEHYPNGPNAHFFAESSSGEALINLLVKFAGPNGKFTDPKGRDIAKNFDALVAKFDIKKGDKVLDVGAGTGLFMEWLHEAVGPTGHVYFSEISGDFLQFLQNRIRKEGRADNASALLCTHEEVVTPDAVDVVLVCDVYHHFEKPVAFMKTVHKCLKEGGSLYLIDFHRDDEKIWSHPKGWVEKHVRAGQDVFREEVEAAGFTYDRDVEVPGLSENYFMVFKK